MNLPQIKVIRSFRNVSLSLILAGSLFGQGTVIAVHTLNDPPLLAAFQNKWLPNSNTLGDGGFKLGGIGSGLFKGPGDGPGIFWMITDRGPNPQDGSSPIRRAFPVPEFTPFILQVKAENGSITIVKAIPITGNNGAVGVTGLPDDPSATNAPAYPLPLADERPFDCNVSGTPKKFTTTITGNFDGHDTEDIVRDVHGNFWTIEEYGPSITKISPTGVVQKRFVPKGRKAVSGTNFPVEDNLPAILARRPRNRGFEGLAITPDQKTLMAVVQSPLTNPSTAVGNPSRVIRIVAFDIPTEKPVAEYVYVMQSVDGFAPSPANSTEMKISAISALDQHRFLVDERTDLVAKLFLIDVRRATNILGTKWDDLPMTTTDVPLESLALYPVPAPPLAPDNLLANEIVQLPKELVSDLSKLRKPNGDPMTLPQKIEGLTVIDGKTIAVSNDNDFQVQNGSATPPVDATCTPATTGADSQIFIIQLDKPIK